MALAAQVLFHNGLGQLQHLILAGLADSDDRTGGRRVAEHRCARELDAAAQPIASGLADQREEMRSDSRGAGLGADRAHLLDVGQRSTLVREHRSGHQPATQLDQLHRSQLGHGTTGLSAPDGQAAALRMTAASSTSARARPIPKWSTPARRAASHASIEVLRSWWANVTTSSHAQTTSAAVSAAAGQPTSTSIPGSTTAGSTGNDLRASWPMATCDRT